MDFRDDLAVDILLHGEKVALENLTIGMVKQDNIECCVCLDFRWGVKLPNCNHYVCAKCYYKIYNGFISSDFYSEHPSPKRPESPIYPYKNQDENKEIFYSITNDDTYLEWFTNENEDLYNSLKINTEFVEDIDINLKTWFKNNELLKQYDNDLIKYKNDLNKYDGDSLRYDYLYEDEKEYNSQKICPLCRL
jgi:hypothetical protein